MDQNKLTLLDGHKSAQQTQGSAMTGNSLQTKPLHSKRVRSLPVSIHTGQSQLLACSVPELFPAHSPPASARVCRWEEESLIRFTQHMTGRLGEC